VSGRERTGHRDLLFSPWHRPDSLVRFLSRFDAERCAVIDVDFCEYCMKCNQPLALVEAQHSTARPKPATVTANLASLAGIPAYSVSYAKTATQLDVDSLRVQRIAPDVSAVREMTPREYANWLLALRVTHEQTACRSPHADRDEEAA
jgi:hypothetical protein